MRCFDIVLQDRDFESQLGKVNKGDEHVLEDYVKKERVLRERGQESQDII